MATVTTHIEHMMNMVIMIAMKVLASIPRILSLTSLVSAVQETKVAMIAGRGSGLHRTYRHTRRDLFRHCCPRNDWSHRTTSLSICKMYSNTCVLCNEPLWKRNRVSHSTHSWSSGDQRRSNYELLWTQWSLDESHCPDCCTDRWYTWG